MGNSVQPFPALVFYLPVYAFRPISGPFMPLLAIRYTLAQKVHHGQILRNGTASQVVAFVWCHAKI
jgi:hypothetical protein